MGVLLSLLLAVGTSHAARGVLDPSFGGDGVVALDVGSQDPNVEGRAVLVQPDGRIVAVGTGGTPYDTTFIRLMPDGTLDGSFGGTGIVTVPFGRSGSKGRAAVLQPDGRIVAAGLGPGVLQQGFAVARVLPDGTPDDSFDGDGRAEASFGLRTAIGSAVALQPDGKIVVAGQLDDEAPQFSYDFALVRFTADGALDSTFGDGGLVTTDLAGGGDGIEAMGLDGSGRIVVAGRMSPAGSQGRFALARYLPDGTLDASFGEGGIVLPVTGASSATALLVLPDDSIIVGAEEFAWTLRRFLPDGSLDEEFGDGGVAMTYLPLENAAGQLFPRAGVPRAILREPDGHLVVAGGAIYAGELSALARYDAAGRIDTSFGWQGVAVVQDGPGARTAFDAALQSDGRIVTVGYVDFPRTDPRAIVVARHVVGPFCGGTGGTLSRARLRFGRVDDVDGNDALTVRASATFGAPVTLRPDTTGVRVLIEDADGGTVLETTVPSGAWDPESRSGWRAKADGSAWRYDSPAVAGRLHVRKATVRLGREPARVDVSVATSRGQFTRGAEPLPWSLSVVVDGAAGECATTAFTAPRRCVTGRDGAVVSCR